MAPDSIYYRGFLIFYIHFIHNSTKNIKFLHKKEGVLQLDVEILNITREIRLYNTTHSHLVDDFRKGVDL